MEPDLLWLAVRLSTLPSASSFAAGPPRGGAVNGSEPGSGGLPSPPSLGREMGEGVLERLACWAGCFTPRLTLVPPRTLLLEVGGCRRLFGGLDRLERQVAKGLAEQGADAVLAFALTPQAALWRAEGGGNELDALPVACLSWPGDTAARLDRFGLRTLGEVRRLPAAALGRRLGREAMTLIARAYGELPDPRPDYVFPLVFELAQELPAPVEHAAALLFVARRLTAALSGWLSVRQAGLRECELRITHRGRPATVLTLRFATLTRDGGRLERVLRERLDRLFLPAPAETIVLKATTVESLAGRSGDLFGDFGADRFPALLERLRSRLGEARVQGLGLVPAHRPECASRNTPADAAGMSFPCRPLWLLARPEPLTERRGRPHRRGGPIRLLAGPERIESGWWDQGEGVGDQRRDYFIGLTADARWAWIFRELRSPGGWFLHGWFG